MAIAPTAAATRVPRQRYRLGIDENGVGPILGPMTVTAVLAEVSEAGHRYTSRSARGRLKERVGDSKGLVSNKDFALGEAWARAILGQRAASIQSQEELVLLLSRAPRAELVSLCPPRAEAQCWGPGRTPLAATDDIVRLAQQDMARFKKNGVLILGVETTVICTKRLNLKADRGVSRFAVDLHAMEEHTLAAHAKVNEEVLSICGKVGGLTKYTTAFGPLGGRLVTTLSEERALSAYQFPGLGELRFVMDADASDKLVSVASLVGKFVREVTMGAINRYYQTHDASLPHASGYHDPVTKRLIGSTQDLRNSMGIPDECFARKKAVQQLR